VPVGDHKHLHSLGAGIAGDISDGSPLDLRPPSGRRSAIKDIETSLDAAAINVMRKKKRNKVEEDNVETPTQRPTGDEKTDV
jgi:hypothetical protein